MPFEGSGPADRDAELIASVAHGDRAAFEALAARHLPRCYTVAKRILNVPEEAEDVAQEALLRLWTHAAGFDPRRASLSTWLHRITLNLALDRYRRMARQSRRLVPLELAEQVPDPAADVQAPSERQAQTAALRRALGALPARQRDAVALTYLAELPAAETAQRLNISVRAVEGLLRRARQALREHLSGQGA